MIRVGISGWRYAPWRGVFYPEGLPHRRELEFCGGHFPTVEVNGSFYSLQRPEYYRAWRDDTPAGFLFAVKGSRYITHMLKVRGVEKPLANFYASGVLELGGKLGPFLWQLPPQLAFDEERLARFFAMLPRDTVQALALARRRDARMKGRASLRIDAHRPLRHAVEVRHSSFENKRFLDLLEKNHIGLVVADTAGKWPKMFKVTADFVYVRLHGDSKIYSSGYSERALASWARRIRGWDEAGLDVYVYFDNDAKVRAPFDALNLMHRLRLRWRPAERAPLATRDCFPRRSGIRTAGTRAPRSRAESGARAAGG